MYPWVSMGGGFKYLKKNFAEEKANWKRNILFLPMLKVSNLFLLIDGDWDENYLFILFRVKQLPCCHLKDRSINSTKYRSNWRKILGSSSGAEGNIFLSHLTGAVRNKNSFLADMTVQGVGGGNPCPLIKCKFLLWGGKPSICTL